MADRAVGGPTGVGDLARCETADVDAACNTKKFVKGTEQ